MKLKLMLLILAMAALLSSVMGKSIPTQVPAAVAQSFVSHFHSVKAVEWTSEPDGFEADFVRHGHSVQVLFDKEGRLLSQKIGIRKQALPLSARRLIGSCYEGYVLEAARRVSYGSGVQYEATIARAEEELVLVFTADGRLKS